MKSEENNQVKSDRAVKGVVIGIYDPELTDGVPVRRVSSNRANVGVKPLAESLDDLLPSYTDKSPFMTFFGPEK